MTSTDNSNLFGYLFEQANAVQRTSEAFWKNEAVQRLITSGEKYDVSLIFQFDSDSILGLAQHVGASIILFSPVGASVTSRYVGNPNLACYTCPFNLLAADVRTFLGRLMTATMNCFFYLEELFIIHPFQQNLLRKYLPESPALGEILRNVSLVLLNSHFSVESPRPHVPNMVQIGGFHTEDLGKLPVDIQEYLDSAKEGAVLFSFGTNLKLAALDQDKLQVILRGLGKISPMKVLFKSDIQLVDVPENVIVRQWLPQSEVLAHPNVKLFISHGGLGGTTEAVYHGVPMLGIPFFADQKANILTTSEAGYTVPLNYDEMTQKSFDKALQEVLTDPKYTNNVKKYSSLLRNQPIKPLDHAIWWVEHIIQYKGGNHLKNIGIDLSCGRAYDPQKAALKEAANNEKDDTVAIALDYTQNQPLSLIPVQEVFY
ncbi:hypothetical protein HHI36_003566 [Cryptolaemus montrouzieri]|uniref:UDP-glucuronosyltransferase n=1 Tax=Cryptolaemus montrouzieri TaxID=559131 RepID=A0ABD2PE78_9CUCU